MKKLLILFLAVSTLVGCNQIPNGFHFQIRKDKVSWTNGIIEFRTDMNSNGKRNDNLGFTALIKSGNGHTIKMPDSHLLGYGASCPMGESGLYKDEHGYSQAEILTQTEDKMVIHLHHDQWELYEVPVSFDKQITLFRDSPIMAVIDYYAGAFELLNVAAGVAAVRDCMVEELENGYAIEYPNGVTSIIIMHQMEEKSFNETRGSVFVTKEVTPDEPLRYYVGLSDKGKEYLLEELDKIL
jgi:hypothetical protein